MACTAGFGGGMIMGGMNPFGWLFQLLILVAFFLIVYWIISGARNSDSSKDIIKKRYARGEISKKEFEELKKEMED